MMDTLNDLIAQIHWALEHVMGSGSSLSSQDLQDELINFVRSFWDLMRALIAVIAVITFVSSVDDFLVDITYWALRVSRLFTWPFRKALKTSDLHRKPEQRIAIMIPAWMEAEVIGRMVSNLVDTQDYSNYAVFIGTYPNDAATIREVDKLAAQHARVHRATCASKGPTSKADCLNAIVSHIFQYEKEHGQQFDVFALQDPEDIVHPLTLKLMNATIPEADMVQLAVRSLPRAWTRMVACHYMDEFAELHLKDLVVRSEMTANVPSAGVGSAFGRKAILALGEDRDGEAFNEDTLTEDYEIGMRLGEYGLKGRFVHFRAKVKRQGKKLFGIVPLMRSRKELVATYEFFPDTIKGAVRQKARWILGISYLGWKHLKWRGALAHRYWLMRDRKVILTAPTAALGYLIVLNVLITWLVLFLFPDLITLPPLVDVDSWIWTLILIDFFFLLNRAFHRAIFVGIAHGWKYVPLSPLRIVISNWVGFLAWFRAVRRLVWHEATGRRIRWDKTKHEYPSAALLPAADPSARSFWRPARLRDLVAPDHDTRHVAQPSSPPVASQGAAR